MNIDKNRTAIAYDASQPLTALQNRELILGIDLRESGLFRARYYLIPILRGVCLRDSAIRRLASSH